MKAIIIAAGQGTRLHPYTLECPKPLLKIGARSMLERQVDAYRAGGIKDVVVVVGYQAEQFPDLGVTYVRNDRYRENSVLVSLMYAREYMQDGFIASYSDLIFSPELVKELIDSEQDIVLSLDDTWQTRYSTLEHHPTGAVEKVLYDSSLKISKLGKPIEESAPAEFIGLIKASSTGAKLIYTGFQQAKASFEGKPFGYAKTFEKSDLTDLLQYLIEGGTSIYGLIQSRFPWVEVDTAEDLALARKLFVST